ncbi:unnamed protein product [Penicillium egyptiacum]|uniref:Cytochrome P450 n=1 Tax=Penicillium egyptiacum TaxID=1303716 RepID=A0A9W4KD97_9EURO|nr:unnamed protein product [Penicillium egyptiacum]
MCRRYLDAGDREFDWNGPDVDTEWEPFMGLGWLGSRLLGRRMNLSPETTAGMVATVVFGTNANSVPMLLWAMMELIADPELYRAVREECLAASSVDLVSRERIFDPRSLLSKPLLQSPIDLDGHLLPPGSLIQAPSQIGQYNEAVWGTPEHPASQFWAGRHLKHDGGKTQFTMTGKTSSFFPFGTYLLRVLYDCYFVDKFSTGGGPSICPGRVFAKQEILMTIAALVTRFEIEMIDWVHPNGSKSDRPPQNDQSHIGAVGIPPDRDMKIRWMRLW